MISIKKPIIYRNICKQRTIAPIRMPPVRNVNIKPCRVSPDILDTVNTSVYFIGKSVVLFTIFYCSMNWVYYRRMRKDMEKYAEQKKEDAKRRQIEKDRLSPKKDD